jgi:regulator-associated protein of mTOR
LAADFCIVQLPSLLNPDPLKPVEYKHSTFFTDQLSAFEVWLKKGSISSTPPQQLPIVLQVLLSQVHRLRALMLLSKFLDLGSKAVNLSLSVGIFPYVLKLLQSPAAELRPVLVFIWAKLLAVDASCQADLLKDNGYTYFIGILSMPEANMVVIANPSEHRAMCAFVLSVFCTNYPAGQQVFFFNLKACLKNGLLSTLIPHLKDEDSLLRQWICVCFGQFWRNFPDAKHAAIASGVDRALSLLLTDPVAEVRAAATSALCLLLGGLMRNENSDPEETIIIHILKTLSDAAPIVRRELVSGLSRSINYFQTKYILTALELMEEERNQAISTLDERQFSLRNGTSVTDRIKVAEAFTQKTQKSIYNMVWKTVLSLSVDPHPSVSELGIFIVDKIMVKVMQASQNGNSEKSSSLYFKNDRNIAAQSSQSNSSAIPQAIIRSVVDSKNPLVLNSVRNSPSTLKRTTSSSSFVASIQKFFVGINSGLSHESLTPLGLSPVNNNPNRLRRMRPSSMVNISSLSLTEDIPDIRSTPPAAPAVIIDPDLMILESEFFQWSCEYFKEPQMAV